MKKLLQLIMLIIANVSFGQGNLLYHFPFDGDRNSIVNTGSFTSTASPVFVDNGNGVSNGALQVDVTSITQAANSHTANLPLLPQGNAARSISVRINFLSTATNEIFSWGSAVNNLSYGIRKISNGVTSVIWGEDKAVADNIPLNTWVNLVITYNPIDGRANYYRNGNYVGGQNHYQQMPILTNTTGTTAVMGTSVLSTFGTGAFLIDDLRVFDINLTQAQITALNATLSSDSFSINNLKFSMYPNPANSLLKIDIASEVNSVEIYSLLGQKVLSSTEKQINISNLSNEVYLVRVEDENGAIATQKLVKE